MSQPKTVYKKILKPASKYVLKRNRIKELKPFT